MRVTMLLARAPGQPEGDVHDRIELHVKLSPQGRFDQAVWESAGESWPARRVCGAREHVLELVREREQWALRGRGGDDAPLWVLEPGLIRPGEIVTLRQPDGGEALFRIVSVEPD